MKKKGFTLIELLAVIVVLAIIALIATPIVMNVIKNAGMGAAERSADNYVKAVDTLIATSKLDGTPLVDGEYTIGTDGKLTKDGKSYEVEVSGTKPVGGSVVVKDGQVDKDNTAINYEDYIVTFTDGIASAKEKGNALVLCTAIAPVEQGLYDEGVWSMVDTVVGVQATKEEPYTKGAVYKCDLGDGERIFYVLNDTDNAVSLLMEENIGTTVAWCASGEDNSCAADGAIAHLNTQTSGWTKLFSENGAVGLPSMDDLTVVQNEDWLFINLDLGYGYWTSTAITIGSDTAGTVDNSGNFSTGGVSYNEAFGVRPVITISKSNMSL